MARRQGVVQVRMSIEIRKDLRRSPRFRGQNETQLREEFENPNSVRRSPRIWKLGDTNLGPNPKTPNLKSVSNQAGVSCGGERLSQRGVVRKSFVAEPRRSPRIAGESTNSGAFAKKNRAEVTTAGGPENSTGKERAGLRRSPRFSDQQKNYKDVNQELDPVLDEICETDGVSSDQLAKRYIKKSNSPVGSEEEELREMGEDASWKNQGEGAEARKRKRGKEGSEILRGWTKEQEMTLERAYLAMKPTPRFWKKVSKMVGKSAQECFDRINYDPHTPVPPRIRSRIKKKESPPVSGFSLSASKLLGSPKPARKRKTQLGQKKVRELLQKQCNIEKDYKGDLFSVLEGNIPSFPVKVSQQASGLSTPPAVPLRDGSNSFSERKKSVSRLGKTTLLVSPPVLKQVKNKALHEKYIDQLHCREAKRKAEVTRAKKTPFGKENTAPSCSQKPNVVKAAKNALESDARDVIIKFQRAQAESLSNSLSETEDDIRLSSDENEDEV